MKLILITFLASLFYNPHNIIMEKWVIEKNSNLSIEGKSNINSFSCNVTEYLHPDTIVFYKEDQHQELYTVKGGITINVNRFDCHQRNITRDLRKTLKASESPIMKIDLLSISNFSDGYTGQKIKGCVAIKLAGITRKMEIDYTVQTGNDGNLLLYGSRAVLLSDFRLTPPHKLAGLIKVEDQINVRFKLILRSLQNGKSYLWSKQ
jgi:hypothetical protein